jgi:periplasmic protein CpxP/Spy
MKFKFLSGLILVAAAITTTASAIHAQLPPNPGQFPARQGFPVRPPDFKELNLTEEQKDRLKEVQEEIQSSINEILTTEQRDTLKQAVEAGKKPPEVLQSMSLSDEQKQKIQEVMESKKQKMSEILTTEQKQQLRERMGGKHNGRNIPSGFGRFPNGNTPVSIPPQR